MQIDKDKLNSFLGLNDDELKQKVTEAAKLAGLESNKLNYILKDTKKIKNMIGGMTDDELKKMMQTLNDPKIAQMIQNLQN